MLFLILVTLVLLMMLLIENNSFLYKSSSILVVGSNDIHKHIRVESKELTNVLTSKPDETEDVTHTTNNIEDFLDLGELSIKEKDPTEQPTGGAQTIGDKQNENIHDVTTGKIDITGDIQKSRDKGATTYHVTIEPSPTQETSTTITPKTQTIIRDRVIEYCNPTSIVRKNILHRQTSSNTTTKDKVACVPITTTEEGCKLAAKLYSPDKTLKQCESSDPIVEICHQVESGQLKQQHRHQFKCSFSDCTRKYSKQKVAVRMVNDQNGNLKSHRRIFNNAKNLEKALPRIATKTLSEGYGFLILQCIDDHEDVSIDKIKAPEIAQLLILPPLFSKIRNKEKRGQQQQQQQQRKQEIINLNIILMDSASRSHFYRSLPKTIKTFEEINQDSKVSSAAEVFYLFLF